MWLTVNEYETMLMRNDLPEVLRDPLRYMLRHSKALLCHPAAIPAKMRDYALYDLIHLYNEVMDNVPIGRALIERGLSFLSGPASRLFRLKRGIESCSSLGVAMQDGNAFCKGSTKVLSSSNTSKLRTASVGWRLPSGLFIR